MGNIAFGPSKAQVGYYWGLPGASDGLTLVPLSAVEADATLASYTNLASLLAGSSNEQTTIGRIALTGVTVTVNGTNTVDLDSNDASWVSTSGSNLVAVVICYVPNTSTSTDADLIPLCKQDYVATVGGALTVQIAPAIRVS